jgi:hypothetical protein
MSNFKSKLLYKVLDEEILNDFEQKKFEEYLKKINIMTYMMYEDRLHMLDEEYVKWCKLKIEEINYELSKDINIIKFLNK